MALAGAPASPKQGAVPLYLSPFLGVSLKRELVNERLEHFKLFVRHFAPSWMVITMGTGSLAITISLFPFPFPGQQGIALAIWGLDAALFLLFLALLVGRAACYPGSFKELLEVPNQSLFLGTVPMSISAITAGVQLLLVPRCGEGALMAAHVLVWLNVPIVAVVALLIPLYMFSVHDYSMLAMTALWLLPVIPGTTAAAVTGGVSATLHHGQAVLLLYLGLCMLAVGAALSSSLLTMYYQRLICHSLPPREVIVSSFIPVGAVGMAGWALLNLAHAADLHLRSYYEQLPDTHASSAWLDAVLPAALAAAGVLGLALWAISGWWLVLAVSSVGQTLRQGIPFTLASWGSVFPVGTFAGLTITLGSFFHVYHFKILGAVVACCQAALWLFVTGMTLHKGLAGDLFHPPCLAPPPGDPEEVPDKIIELENKLTEAESLSQPLGARHESLGNMPDSMPRGMLLCRMHQSFSNAQQPLGGGERWRQQPLGGSERRHQRPLGGSDRRQQQLLTLCVGQPPEQLPEQLPEHPPGSSSGGNPLQRQPSRLARQLADLSETHPYQPSFQDGLPPHHTALRRDVLMTQQLPRDKDVDTHATPAAQPPADVVGVQLEGCSSSSSHSACPV